MEYPLLPPEKLTKETLAQPVVQVDNSYLHTVLQGILGALRGHGDRLDRVEKAVAGVEEGVVVVKEYGDNVAGMMKRMSEVEKELEGLRGLEREVAERPGVERVKELIGDAVEGMKRADRIQERNEERSRQDMNFQSQIENLMAQNASLEDALAKQRAMIDELSNRLSTATPQHPATTSPDPTSIQVTALYDVFELDKDKVLEAVSQDKANPPTRPVTAATESSNFNTTNHSDRRSPSPGTGPTPHANGANPNGSDSVNPNANGANTNAGGIPNANSAYPNANSANSNAGGIPNVNGAYANVNANASANGANSNGNANGAYATANASPNRETITSSKSDRDRTGDSTLTPPAPGRPATARPETSQSSNPFLGSGPLHRGSISSDVGSDGSKCVKLLHSTPALSSIIQAQLSDVVNDMNDRLVAARDVTDRTMQMLNRKFDDLNDRFEVQQDLHQRTLSRDGRPGTPPGGEYARKHHPGDDVQVMQIEPQGVSGEVQDQFDKFAMYLDGHQRDIRSLHDTKLNVDDTVLQDMREAVVILKDKLNDVCGELGGTGSAKAGSTGKQQPHPSFEDLGTVTLKLDNVQRQLEKLNKYKANRSELNKTKASILRKSQEFEFAVQTGISGETVAALRYKCLSCQGPAERNEDITVPKPVRIFPPGSVLVSPTSTTTGISPKSYIEWSNRMPTPKGGTGEMVRSTGADEVSPAPSPPTKKRQVRARIVGTDRKIYQGGLGDFDGTAGSPDSVIPLEQSPDMSEVHAG